MTDPVGISLKDGDILVSRITYEIQGEGLWEEITIKRLAVPQYPKITDWID